MCADYDSNKTISQSSSKGPKPGQGRNVEQNVEQKNVQGSGTNGEEEGNRLGFPLASLGKLLRFVEITVRSNSL